MEQNEDLARLEQFVEKLIDSHNELKNENDDWEKTFEQEDSAQDSSSGAGKKQRREKKSSSLFNVKAEQSSKPALR